jgi:hypothetical protein
VTEPIPAERVEQVGARVEAHIAGQISGQVAVGSYDVQTGSVYGGVVTVALPGQQPVPRQLPPPVRLCPISLTETFGRLTKLPALAGMVTGVLVHPTVGRLVAAAGDLVADEFRRRIAPEAGPAPQGG